MEQTLDSPKQNEIIEFTHIQPTQFQLAIKDLIDSLHIWKLWGFLGWNDIKMRYRGSVLGPLWITASMLVFIIAFSIVYSRLFHQTLTEYIPFLTSGYLIWLLISSTLMESCNIFLEAAPFVTEIKLPYIMYILRLIWRQLLIFLHNWVVFLFVGLYFQIGINWNFFYVIPGLFLVILNLVSLSLLLSMLGIKYRDIPPVVASIIQVAFFITPISWKPELLNNSLIVFLNPLTYFLDLVRSPLLGQAPTGMSWLVSIVLTITVFYSAFILFAKHRRNIPFWL